LESHKNLVDQCVQGEGLVQINVQVQTSKRRINIADVLKPTDDVLESYEKEKANEAAKSAVQSITEEVAKEKENKIQEPEKPTTPITPSKNTTKGDLEAACAVASLIFSCPPAEEETPIVNQLEPMVEDEEDYDENYDTTNENVVKWVCDVEFKKDQLRMNIPDDPAEWSFGQVKYWIQV
jgi:GA-binding protein transcription factor alpha